MLESPEKWTNYTGFGATMPGRNFSSNSYRYGFNGKETDPETNTQDYGLRMYDPELGKFFSVDPLTASYAFYSPYHFAGNTPIQANDLDGGEPNPKQIGDAAKRGEVSEGFKSVMKSADIKAQITGDINTQMALGVSYAVAGVFEGFLALSVTTPSDLLDNFAMLYKRAYDDCPGDPDLAKQFIQPDVNKITEGTLSGKTEGVANIAFLFVPGLEEERAAVIVEEETIFSRGRRAELPPKPAVEYKNGYRTPNGKFASPTGTSALPGAIAEKTVWDAIEKKPGWSVTRGRVYVKDAQGNVRVYDGVAHSPSGVNIGLEIKSGGATKTKEQRVFDRNLNSSPNNKATGTGKHKGMIISRSIEIKTG